MDGLKSDVKYESLDLSKSENSKNIISKLKYPKVALVGNPNCGKTTLFNQLTGSCQYVGNWPGVTVDLKEGRIKNCDTPINIIDLPGIYSLSPYSPEEIVTRDYVEKQNPDIIVNIIDATNIERNLYLTTQLMEMNCKILLALNMTDLLQKRNKYIDYLKLEQELGIPIIPISASKNKGTDKLIRKIIEILNKGVNLKKRVIKYSDKIENILNYIDNSLENCHDKYIKSHRRFNSIKIFENDPVSIFQSGIGQTKLENIQDLFKASFKEKNSERELIIANKRYAYIGNLCSLTIRDLSPKNNNSFSNKLDSIITGKFTAIPIFLFIISIVFFITFGPVGNFLKVQSENFINLNIKGRTEQILTYLDASKWSQSLILDAVIGGVGAVISFLPQVLILFTLLSILEDSGYMARAAFIMDKLLRKIGLSGKAFIPLLMGFGCSVPAVLGARILEDKKDKNLTIFLIPFMSCSAKMPLYLLISSSFFPENQMLAVFSIYIWGIIAAIFSSFIFRESLFDGESTHFIMEIPEYRIPSLKNLCLHVWDRVKDFIERAGTIILAATIIIWFLQSFNINFKLVEDNSQSILAFIGNIICPVFSVCGFGDWRAVVSLITGLIAKESIVSSLSVLYNSQGAESLSQILSESFSPYAAYAFMIFVLLYTPCIAAVSTMYKELKSLKLTLISVFYQFFIAFLLSALVYQIGTLYSKIF